MLKLYGFDVSNYYNMARLALMIKGIPYEPVLTYPNQTDEFLAVSPMGKVPLLETPDGVLCETNVILEYIDALESDVSLYPGSLYESSRVKEVTKICELYLELPARRCFAEAFFGSTVEQSVKDEVKATLLKGVAALGRVADFSPYLTGDKLTAADIVFLYSADLAAAAAGKLFDMDLFAELPQAKSLMALLNERKDVQQIKADKEAASPAFYEYVRKSMAARAN